MLYAYLADGRYLWNSGMFLFKASAYLNELRQFCPKMVDACKQSLELAQDDLDFIIWLRRPLSMLVG